MSGTDEGTVDRWARLEPLLEEALNLDPERWPAFLDRVAEGAPHLRSELESLLRRRAQVEDFLERAPIAEIEEAIGEVGAPPEGTRFGPYRVVCRIGEGGMGRVFLGERADGLFQRRVALKLLRPFLAADAARRFEAERRILARLDHPSIACLIDAGVTPEGRPYLVTEYVDGVPIDAHCRGRGLGLSERLELFRQVARAVEHAHRNLLVHRDLKPSNILVGADGRARLLDFGVAEPLGEDRLHEGSFQGSGWLTPGYAAPEQLGGGPVTTATDVYQLGLLLEELLHEIPTGSRLAADLGAVAARARRARPEDRYPSVRAILDDLERAVENRPLTAHGATRRYRLACLLRRRRVEAAAAAAVVAALVVGFGAALWQAGVATRERDEAREATLRTEEALAQAREVTGFLLALFHDADPWSGRLRDPVAARELLELGTAHVEALQGQPPVQAALLEVLARVRLSLGQAGEAEPLARRAVTLRRGGADPDVAALAGGLDLLGEILAHKGSWSQAGDAHAEAFVFQTAEFGEAHPGVARTLHLMARHREAESLAESEALDRRALEIRRATLGSDHPLTIASLRRLGRLMRAKGEPERAEQYLTEAVDRLRSTLGPDHPDLAEAKLNLADLLQTYGLRPGQAEALYAASLRIQREALGDRYPGLTHPIENLAYLASARGDHAEAEALLREGLTLRRSVFPPEHPGIAEGLGYLANELRIQGRLDEAETLRHEEIALWREALGPDHCHVAGALGELAGVRAERGDHAGAEALYLEAITLRSAARGTRAGTVAVLNGELGRLYAAMGQSERAEAAYRTALDILLDGRTEKHPDVLRIRAYLAELREVSLAAGNDTGNVPAADGG